MDTPEKHIGGAGEGLAQAKGALLGDAAADQVGEGGARRRH